MDTAGRDLANVWFGKRRKAAKIDYDDICLGTTFYLFYGVKPCRFSSQTNNLISGLNEFM
jgi:hypothetical protein